MKENFVITPGNLEYDSDVDKLNIYYYRQTTAYTLMLIGAVLVLIAVYT